MSVVAAMAIGLAAGAAAGTMGIGGGILFVPALAIFLDKTQIEAEATSLIAIVPVAIVGAWRQAHYGNVRIGDGLRIGVFSLLGAIAGAIVANALSQRALEICFGLLMLTVALRLVRQAFRQPPEPPVGAPSEPRQVSPGAIRPVELCRAGSAEQSIEEAATDRAARPAAA
jgi:uncharacterized membrane protein YfcA